VFPGNEPILTAAWSSAVFECVKECLIPRLVGVSVDSNEHLTELLEDVKGNRHAKALIDLAWWDLNARIQNQPLPQFLGGDPNKEIELGLTFDRFETPDELLDEIRRAVDEGFKRITLKIRPGWDLQILNFVRSEHPLLPIQCDIEGSLDINLHSEILYRFDDFMPSLLEQPLSASEFVGHAMLQDSLKTPVGLDESITTIHQADIAIDLRSASAFCLKPGRVGGLTEAKAIHDLASKSEIDCYAGTDILTSIGYRFVAALSSLPGVNLPADYIRFSEYRQDDPGAALQPLLSKGRQVIKLWNEPGIGIDPNVEIIEKYTLRCFRSP
jgi:O-succinylbenzoate synthase